MPRDLPWPPHGITLTFKYQMTDKILKNISVPAGEHLDYLKQVSIDIHYAIYDGIPLICKWLTVENHSSNKIEVVHFINEILATPEAESQPADLYGKGWLLPNITVQTNYEFGGATGSGASLGKSVHWKVDPKYKSQVNYNYKTKCLLETYPNWGPAQDIVSGGTFSSFRTWELVHDSWNRERKGLEIRRMYRTISPWVTENPIYFSVIHSDTKSVKKAINQAAAVGFQMVDMSFGSGFNIEDTSRTNYQRMKMLDDYAKSRGIALGGYSLLASRHVGGGNDVVMPKGMKPVFGHSPCLASKWGLNYFHKLYAFFDSTGMNDFINDGSYPGDVCAATWHSGHKGLPDSQWKQFKIISHFYHWCLARGVYLIVPDWYFLNGSNKTAMGYRETDWSLPRRKQVILERQNIYDGTWTKTPSMGWMFVPLTEYHGGGAAATIAPLKDHLTRYKQAFADLFGDGVSGNFRGLELYDSRKTETLVKHWVSFYKKHFAILNSDIIHVRRPDGQNISCILHVNPYLKDKGMAMVYNPLDHPVKRELKLPLYYTGLTNSATIVQKNSRTKKFKLDRKYDITVPIDVKANSYTWLIIK